jgi:NADPH-dependent 7-cyano-7-deazaguanine reductase QueF
VNSVYMDKNSLLECVCIIQNENGWAEISIKRAVALARLLNDEAFLYFLSSFFHSVLLHMDILYNTLQKVSSNAVSVCKAI